jgi:cytoskeletal protein CcmA (bactofilin family)
MPDYPSITTQSDHDGLATLGSTMPDADKIPVLTQVATHDTLRSNHGILNTTNRLCLIEAGLTFTGNILLQGPCTIAGHVVGNLREHVNAVSQIVITETGSLDGDILSHKVSVMGRCNGTIDASGGSVDLHAGSVVTGHIRYGQLQVNGADLNATLERVAAKANGPSAG